MIEEIKEHFKKEYPREGCGIIGIVKGKKKWFPCKNIAEDEENFVMDSNDWFYVKSRADIFAIVHSHPDSSNEASNIDIENCNAVGVPYYIFSYPDMELNIVEPKVFSYPLIGREYKFGTKDCFEAIRDWLNSEGKNVPPRALFEDYWWEKDLDYLGEKVLGEWGFTKINEPPKRNDLLIFAIESTKGNHCGVYLENDIFFHHAENRLSCRESLYPFWGKHIIGVYRHET